jgi:hypothetical protein
VGSAFRNTRVVLLVFVLAAIAFGFLAVASWTHRDSFLSGSVADKVVMTCCSIGFSAAAVRARWTRRSGLLIAIANALAAAIVLIRSELSFAPWVNSWTALNLPSEMYHWFSDVVMFAQIRISATALVVVAFVISLLRLLPSNWTLRKTPVCEMTWPAFFAALAVLATWFHYSVLPYRVAGIVDRDVSPDLVILHVEKHGLRFRETATDLLLRSGNFFMRTTERRLFEYKFISNKAMGASGIPSSIDSRALSSLQLPPIAKSDWSCAGPIRSWDEDAWYVLTRTGLRCFLRSQNSVPPAQITETLSQISIQPLRGREILEGRDICLGFCYDPVAGLGFVFANQRCSTYPNGKAMCR